MKDTAREFATEWLERRLPSEDSLSDSELDAVISEMLLVAEQRGYAPSEIALALSTFLAELQNDAAQ